MEKAYDVLIVGGGVSGLLAAWFLSRAGRRALVLEKDRRTGGLHRPVRKGGLLLDPYYHHLMRSDINARRVFDALGQEVRWFKAKTAFYQKNGLFPFSGAKDALLSPLLSPRARLAYLAGFVKVAAARNMPPLDQGMEDWARQTFGKEAARLLWQPLFEGRWNRHAPRIPAAWLWWRLKKRLSNMGRPPFGEQLGYPSRGYAPLLDSLENDIQKRGSRIITEAGAERIEKTGRGYAAITSQGRFEAPECVLALPFGAISRLSGSGAEAVSTRLAGVSHMGALCLTLVLSRRATPYYWVNVARAGAPVCGVIEHTNMAPASWYDNRRVVYLVRYAPSEDPVWNLSDDQIRQSFSDFLFEIAPGLSREHVLDSHLARTRFSNAVRDARLARDLASLRQPAPGLYIANDAVQFPDDRGLDVCVKTAKITAEMIVQSRRTI